MTDLVLSKKFKKIKKCTKQTNNNSKHALLVRDTRHFTLITKKKFKKKKIVKNQIESTEKAELVAEG